MVYRMEQRTVGVLALAHGGLQSNANIKVAPSGGFIMKDLRFFLFRLTESEAAKIGALIEVQLLKSNGQAKAVGYANLDSKSIFVDGYEVGPTVLERAHALPEGTGIYVDIFGNELTPF